MTADADDRTVYVIFPEGRLFTPTVRDRALSRLADSDRARADRLAGLSHMLPPRPGGLLTLLAALPRADVVLLDHRGLDDYRNLGDLAKVAPVGDAIEIGVERFARSEIPTDTAEQIRWLDELWLGLDAEIAAERT